jgi:hypothetical protein
LRSFLSSNNHYPLECDIAAIIRRLEARRDGKIFYAGFASFLNEPSGKIMKTSANCFHNTSKLAFSPTGKLWSNKKRT